MNIHVERKPSISGRPERYIQAVWEFVANKIIVRIVNAKTKKDVTNKYYITIEL